MGVYKPKGSNNWWFEFVFNGKRVRESTKQSNRRAAEQIEAARRTQFAKGEVGIEERKLVPTLAKFEASFLDAVRIQCGEKTADWYGSVLRTVLAYKPMGAARLDAIDEKAIEAYAQARSRAYCKYKTKRRLLRPSSINRELATIRRLLRLAHEWRLIQRVPRIRLLGGERQREFTLTRKAEELYLAACQGPLADVAAFLLDTGLRLGEALSLEWPQVRIDPAGGSMRGAVTVLGEKAKSGRTRHVPLTARAESLLKKWHGQRAGGFVFHHEDGNRLLETSLAHQHKRVRELLKMPQEFVLHSLRHTYGTRLGESGSADAFTIMRLMGHASITTSQRYVHPTPETMERAVRRMEGDMAEVPINSPIAADTKVDAKRELV